MLYYFSKGRFNMITFTGSKDYNAYKNEKSRAQLFKTCDDFKLLTKKFFFSSKKYYLNLFFEY